MIRGRGYPSLPSAHWDVLGSFKKIIIFSAHVLSYFSHVQLFATLWIIACQVPLSMGFSRQYWSGLSFLPPGDLPNPGIKPVSLKSPALVGAFFTTSTAWEAIIMFRSHPQNSDPTGLGEASPGYLFFFKFPR